MGSRWLKIQDRSFASEFKNTKLKVWRWTINHVINGGWAWISMTLGYSIDLQSCLMALSLGPQHWLGPEGALRCCPVTGAWLTALMKPAIVGQGTTQEQALNFNRPVWRPKSFDFSAVVRGWKEDPCGRLAVPGLPLNIPPFTACQFLVLEMHGRDVGGWLW